MLSRHPTLFLAMFSWPPGCLRPFNKLCSPRFGLGTQCGWTLKCANAPGIMEQRGLYGTASDAGALPLICDMETTTNNKENNEAHAVAREVEHAASKVSNAPHIRHPTQCLIRAALCPV